MNTPFALTVRLHRPPSMALAGPQRRRGLATKIRRTVHPIRESGDTTYDNRREGPAAVMEPVAAAGNHKDLAGDLETTATTAKDQY